MGRTCSDAVNAPATSAGAPFCTVAVLRLWRLGSKVVP
jgi:hypothetical protein